MSGVPQAVAGEWHRRLTPVVAVSIVVVLSLGLATAAGRGGLLPATEVALQQLGGPAGPEPDEGPPTGDDAARVSHRGTVVDVPTHDLDYLPEVIGVAVLRGDPDLDGGCLWLEMEGVPQAVRWRSGSQAHFLPSGEAGSPELLDAAGQVLARDGQTVYFTGARSGAAERLDRCHVGEDHVWYVGEVTTESPFD